MEGQPEEAPSEQAPRAPAVQLQREAPVAEPPERTEVTMERAGAPWPALLAPRAAAAEEEPLAQPAREAVRVAPALPPAWLGRPAWAANAFAPSGSSHVKTDASTLLPV